MGEYIDLKAADGFANRNYLAQHVGRPHAAVVILQERDHRHMGWPTAGRQIRPHAECFGVGAATRAMTDFFASLGYLAIAPSTFNRGRNGADFGFRYEETAHGFRLQRPLQALPSPRVMLDIAAAVLHGKRHTTAAQVGLVGFCWGGLLAWRAAASLTDVDAVVCFDGGGMTQPEERALVPRCPVLAHFSQDRDWISPESVEAFASLAKANPKPQASVQVHDYPAQYGFGMQSDRDLNDANAALARSRMLEFLKLYLPGR